MLENASKDINGLEILFVVEIDTGDCNVFVIREHTLEIIDRNGPEKRLARTPYTNVRKKCFPNSSYRPISNGLEKRESYDRQGTTTQQCHHLSNAER